MVPFLYQLGIVLVAVSLPFSNFGMSVGSFWILGAWLIDHFTSSPQNLRYRWTKALRNPMFWVLLLVFLIHVFGLIHTSNWSYAMRDLRIKLPLLLFPVIFFTARPLEGNIFRRMWVFFVLACGLAAAYCLLIHLGIVAHEVNNIRDISIFISHIRFSMLLIFASAVLAVWLSRKKYIVLSIVLLAVNLTFIWVIESLTGVALLIFTLFLLVVSEEIKLLRKPARRILRLAVLLFFGLSAGWIGWQAKTYFSLPEDHSENLEATTPRGNAYDHYPENTIRENGHFIWRYIAYEELRKGWEQRSDLAFDSLDARNQPLSGTLIRYLASKGLRKDLDGVQALTEEDVHRIEQGIPTVLEFEHNGIQRRLDKLFFEIAYVGNGGNPGGNSVTQRIEFWKAAWYCISKRPVFGHGTGDVQDCMAEAYNAVETPLPEDYRLHPHNQYLSFWIAFGVIGVLVLLAILFLPLGVQAPERGLLFTLFIWMMALSFFTEDTLETQAGVTLFAFFASLFAAQRLNFHSRVRGQRRSANAKASPSSSASHQQ